MNNWRTVAKLQSIKAVNLALKGKSDQALQEAIKINKLGYNIISGQNSLIGTLVGIETKNIGAKTIIYILPDNNSKKEILASAINNLNNSSDDLEGYRKAFKFEYLNVINSIDQIKSSLQEEIKKADPASSQYTNFGYYFKLNQTKNLFTEFYKVPVSTIGIKCKVDDSFSDQLKSDTEKLTGWRIMFTENAIGKILVSVNSNSFVGVVTKQCQADFISNVTKVELALKQYKIDHKALPPSLSDLVPTYISSIPLDTFDNKPIKYSVDKKILYSVGLNQKDLGGSSGDDYTKMENPTVKIEF
jgi:hypothetical protein